jgi:NADH dehydrogenase
MKIVVTGATGYIGERLVRHAVSLGHEVIAASRRPVNSQIEWIPFDLSVANEISFPNKIDAVFHLAAATTMNIDPAMEIGAAQGLIKSGEQVGAKFIFVSSQTASENAPTAYGKTKWEIEKLILASGGWIVRPGQVYGGAERGLFGVLVSVVRKLPVIPAFLPAAKIQPVHVDDLVLALLRCAESTSIPSSVLCIGASQPISFTHFLRTIALMRLRRIRLPVPVPVALVRLAGVVIGARLRTKLGLDRLSSLFDLPAMLTECDMQSLGLSLRPLSSGMTRSGNDRRRSLIREGLALLTYMLRVRPTPALVRRYVRCIERIRGGQALTLPQFVFRFPACIALLEQSGTVDAEIIWRLNASVNFAEASVQGARRFLAIGETSNFFTNGVLMTCAVTSEMWWRMLRLIAAPVLRPLLHRRSQ